MYPAFPVYQMDLASNHKNLGILLMRLGEREPARKEYEAARDLLKALVAKHPAVPAYQVELGGTCCNIGILHQFEEQPAKSLDWFNEAITRLEPAHRNEPRDVIVKQYLRNSHGSRAMAFDALQKHTDAVKDWDRAIELSPPAEQAGFRARRATSRLQAGQVAEAVAEVVELTKSPNWNAGQWYDFACVYAVANGKLADKKLGFADRAMESLHKAAKAGYKDAAHMKKDKDLDPIRDREDFKKLLTELETKKK
jgi:tetratricopeptide (TPR) repeat protein